MGRNQAERASHMKIQTICFKGKGKTSQRQVPRYQRVNTAEDNELEKHCQKAELRTNQETFCAPGEIGGPENIPSILYFIQFSFPFPSSPLPSSSFPFPLSLSLRPLLPPFLLVSIPLFPSFFSSFLCLTHL